MILEPLLVNTPIVDAAGYCRAELTNVTYLEPAATECGSAQYRFDFSVPITRGNIQLQLLTGTRINREESYIGSQTENYNQLTRLFLALGLLSKPELQTIRHADLEPQAIEATLASLIQQPVRFKFLPIALVECPHQIDIDSVRLLNVLV